MAPFLDWAVGAIVWALVNEGRRSRIEPPEADDDELLLEVRRDREAHRLDGAIGDTNTADH